MRRDIQKIMNFTNELINIFTDYSFSLEPYFKNEDNRKNNQALYEEFLTLNNNIKKLKGKYKL